MKTKSQQFVEAYEALCKEYGHEIVNTGPDEFVAIKQDYENGLWLQDEDSWRAFNIKCRLEVERRKKEGMVNFLKWLDTTDHHDADLYYYLDRKMRNKQIPSEHIEAHREYLYMPNEEKISTVAGLTAYGVTYEEPTPLSSPPILNYELIRWEKR